MYYIEVVLYLYCSVAYLTVQYHFLSFLQALLKWLRHVGALVDKSEPPEGRRYESSSCTEALLMSGEVDMHYKSLHLAALQEKRSGRPTGAVKEKLRVLKTESAVRRAKNQYRDLDLEQLGQLSVMGWTQWAHSQCQKLARIRGFHWQVSVPDFGPVESLLVDGERITAATVPVPLPVSRSRMTAV